MNPIKRSLAPLFALKGNTRYAVFTEPLWGIPFNLYAPFFQLYMFSLGVYDANIGLIVTIGLIVQMLASPLGGILTDKFGRRTTNLIWDHLAWTVPCLIWAFAQDFRWFVVAAIFNGLWPIGANSWECLLVEDENPDKIVQVFNWIHIAGLLAVFVAPISGLLVNSYGVVPVMRVLLVFAAVSMSAKFIVHYIYATETGQGKIRLQETKGVPIYKLLLGYGEVIALILKNPATLRILALITVLQIQQMIFNSFFALYVTENLGIPESHMVIFSIVRGIIMLVFFLALQSFLNKLPIYSVMLVGIGLYIGAYVLLLAAPVNMMLPIIIFTMVDACATALFWPRRDTLVVNNVDPGERARIRAVLTAIMLGAASPFGFIAGQVAEIDRRIIFVACIGLFIIIAGIVYLEKRSKERNK